MTEETRTERALGNDILWGVAEIAKEINRTERQTFHLLEKGHLPVKKVGGRWCASSDFAAIFRKSVPDGGSVSPMLPSTCRRRAPDVLRPPHLGFPRFMEARP